MNTVAMFKSNLWLRAGIGLALMFVFGVSAGHAQDDSEKLLRDAESAMQDQDFETAVELLTKFTKKVDDNGLAWFQLGYSLHMCKKMDEAIKAHTKAAEFAEFKATALYNLGCAYSIKKDATRSLSYLHKALDAGFRDFRQFGIDSDLDHVKKADGYSEIKDRLANGGKRVAKFDAKSLVGDWAVKKGMRQGEEIGAERLPPQITVSEKAFTIPTGEGVEFVMGYKVAGVKDGIAKLDLVIEKGPQGTEGSQAKGIIKMEGKKAMLCYDPTGGEYPTKFETSEENGFFMFMMEANAKSMAAQLVGKWKVVSGQKQGEESAKEAIANIITVTEKTFTIPAGPDEKFVMSYKIDESSSPAKIDLKIESGPVPDGKAAGIIKLKDGKMWLCYNAMGPERPAKFDSTEENGFFNFEMKKVD